MSQQALHYRDLVKDFPEPLLAVLPILTSHGVRFPLVFREKGVDCWWDLPGGKRKPYEDPFEALEKECLEEIDVRAAAHAHIVSAAHPLKGMPQRHFCAVSYISGTPVNKVPDEHLDMQLFKVWDAVNLVRARSPSIVQDYMIISARQLERAKDAPVLKLDI